jgi:hypothetical protein
VRKQSIHIFEVSDQEYTLPAGKDLEGDLKNLAQSASAKDAWARHTPYQRALRGMKVAMGHQHSRHIASGTTCDCEEEWDRRIKELLLKFGKVGP